MKLDPVGLLMLNLKSSYFYRGSARDHLKIFRKLLDTVSMRHPDLGIAVNFLKQIHMSVDIFEGGPSILSGCGWGYLATILESDELSSIAYPQNGKSPPKPVQVYIGSTFVPDGTWATRKDHPLDVG